MKRLLLIAGVLAVLSAIGAATWFVWALRPERVREHLITAVSNRFAARVDVDSANVAIYPRPAIEGPDCAFNYGTRTLSYRRWCR